MGAMYTRCKLPILFFFPDGLYFSFSFTKTALFSKFFIDSCVQDIYLRKLGSYGIIGPLGSYIILNFVNYYPFQQSHIGHVTFVDYESHLPYKGVPPRQSMAINIKYVVFVYSCPKKVTGNM